MLETLMVASIGQSISVLLDRELRIVPGDSVADCLCVELHALLSGADPRAFDGLNEAVAGILDSLTGPALHAHLAAFPIQECSYGEPLLSIPVSCCQGRLAYSSSVDLPCGKDEVCKLILILEPSSPAEFV